MLESQVANLRVSLDNLGRRMLLVQFEDGATTFLFPDEVTVE